jgi:hypothetical protein
MVRTHHRPPRDEAQERAEWWLRTLDSLQPVRRRRIIGRRAE